MFHIPPFYKLERSAINKSSTGKIPKWIRLVCSVYLRQKGQASAKAGDNCVILLMGYHGNCVIAELWNYVSLTSFQSSSPEIGISDRRSEINDCRSDLSFEYIVWQL